MTDDSPLTLSEALEGLTMRSLEEWTDCLRGKTPEQMAKFILGELTGYPLHGRHEEDDILKLSRALMAKQMES